LIANAITGRRVSVSVADVGLQ
ncbi:MAG: hypothetical protein QOH07_1703, partial [Mycobacterium sp.]|nr:hypothetical protein [Mycobacterium sp.]